MATVFFSYSHKDEDMRDELEIHLSALKRQGVIQTWHDRRIGAGKDIDPEIDVNLENADIILLLVSPYFIASDYCYNVEMMRAMERHRKGEARVIPVILHPCYWQRTLFGKLRATPPDGKAISKFPNKHDAFLAITTDIGLAAEEIAGSSTADVAQVESEHEGEPIKQPITREKPRSSNLRVRREFTDIEKSRYLCETLEYFANFFENSLAELEARAEGIETEFRRIDANSFTTTIYLRGNRISRCKIWLHTDTYSSEEIRYSLSPEDISYSESLSLVDDGYVLGLKPQRVLYVGSDSEAFLTKEGGAELLWNILITPLQ